MNTCSTPILPFVPGGRTHLLLCALAAALVLPAVASAQVNCGSTCAPGGPRDLDEPREIVAPRGHYVAPPPTGAVTAPSRSWKLPGPALVLPEIRIGLPTLEWGGLARSRRGPQVDLDRGVAPWVENPIYAEEAVARRIANERLYRKLEEAEREREERELERKLECNEEEKRPRALPRCERPAGPAPPLDDVSRYEERLGLLLERDKEIRREMAALLDELKAAREHQTARIERRATDSEMQSPEPDELPCTPVSHETTIKFLR